MDSDSIKVVFHLGGGKMNDNNKWPIYKPNTPTSSITFNIPTQSIMPQKQIPLPILATTQLTLDDIWYNLTIAINKICAN